MIVLGQIVREEILIFPMVFQNMNNNKFPMVFQTMNIPNEHQIIQVSLYQLKPTRITACKLYANSMNENYM